MADTTAHVPAGPESHPTATEVATTTTPVSGLSAARAPHPAPEPAAADAEANAAGVELVGRTSAPVTRLGDAEPAAVLVGAASGARGAEAASTGRSGPPQIVLPPGGTSGPVPGGDLPVWSFRDAPGRPDFAPAPSVDRHQTELPFAPAAVVRAANPRSLPMFGPVGQPRSTLLVPLLAAVTLGVSALVWHHRVNRELEEFDPKVHVRRVRSTLAVAVPWLIGLLVSLAGAVLIIGGRLSFHLPLASQVSTSQAYYLLAGLAIVPYLTLLLPFSVVAVVMTLERVRCVEEHVGTTTDRQVRAVGGSLLLGIPVVGGLILLAGMQRRLNAVWEEMAAAGRPAS